jgi:hypothetical protein
MSLSHSLESLHQKQSLIRDRVRAVFHREANGVYLFGPPGTSKTYLIRTTLNNLGAPHAYSNGHLTPVGLFELIDEHPQSVIVLDDVSTIFGQPQALQILLAALGTTHDGSRTRTIRYKTAHGDRTVQFEGSVIAISNLQLAGHANKVLAALRDRVHVLAFEPTDEEMEAAIYEIAGTAPRGVSTREAIEVAGFLLDQCRMLGVRPSIRIFVDKALPDYRLWHSGNSESDWKDLVRSSLQELVVTQQHGLRDLTRKDQIALERSLVSELCDTIPSPEAQLSAWTQRTGKSKSAFYRRRQELASAGRCSA